MKIVQYFISLFCLVACSIDKTPQTINYGQDQCSFCRMTITNAQFGGQIITKKGKCFKFDDINCMVMYKNKFEKPDNIDALYVANYFEHSKFMNVNEAVFFYSIDIRTPMSSEIVAVATRAQAEKLSADYTGQIIQWTDVEKRYP